MKSISALLAVLIALSIPVASIVSATDAAAMRGGTHKHIKHTSGKRSDTPRGAHPSTGGTKAFLKVNTSNPGLRVKGVDLAQGSLPARTDAGRGPSVNKVCAQ
jgi:hypothetical protein